MLSRTVHGGHYLVVDALNLVSDVLNLVADTLNLATDTGYSIVDVKREIRNSPHSASVIDSVRGLQDLRSSHLSLLLRQTVQSLQRILNIRPITKQLLQIFL